MATIGLVAVALVLTGLLVFVWRVYSSRLHGLQEAERVKEEFFALVSHELRTPLTSIVGYAELLLEDDSMPAEQRRKFTGVINRNGRRLLRLVGDMLFVAKIEAGRVDLEQRQFDLAAVARESVETFAPRAERGGVELRAEIEETGKIIGDPGRIGQAIDNLISNAIKFTPRGGATTVRVRRDESESVVVEVADTGSGISAADQERLFERFFRTVDAAKKSIEGTGLGLTIVKAIVDGHGGQVAVQSEVGKGTTFAIQLPADGKATDVPIVDPNE